MRRIIAFTALTVPLLAGLPAPGRAQNAAQIQRWKDWCAGAEGATPEQSAQGCVNLMRIQHATAVRVHRPAPPPPPLVMSPPPQMLDAGAPLPPGESPAPAPAYPQ